VAASQRGPGGGPPVSRLTTPVNTGALPIASSVPIATPVLATAEKKLSW
jgi:hypothetical protein